MQAPTEAEIDRATDQVLLDALLVEAGLNEEEYRAYLWWREFGNQRAN